MKTTKHYLGCAVVLAFLLIPHGLFAVTHVVNFGGTYGNTYSPASFTAGIGDTVEWVGSSFSIHTLESTTIPATATTWYVNSGTTFMYVIKVAGIYNFQCVQHAALGMTGSFTVSAAGINYSRTSADIPAAITFKVGTLSGSAYCVLNLSRRDIMTLTIFTSDGRIVLRSDPQSYESGAHKIPLTLRVHGSYVARITLGTASFVQKIIL